MSETRDTPRAAPDGARRDADAGEPELIMFLERDQLVLDKSQPVPRAALGPRASLSLWVLRGFAGGVSAMVLYTFVSQAAH